MTSGVFSGMMNGVMLDCTHSARVGLWVEMGLNTGVGWRVDVGIALETKTSVWNEEVDIDAAEANGVRSQKTTMVIPIITAINRLEIHRLITRGRKRILMVDLWINFNQGCPAQQVERHIRSPAPRTPRVATESQMAALFTMRCDQYDVNIL